MIFIFPQAFYRVVLVAVSGESWALWPGGMGVFRCVHFCLLSCRVCFQRMFFISSRSCVARGHARGHSHKLQALPYVLVSNIWCTVRDKICGRWLVLSIVLRKGQKCDYLHLYLGSKYRLAWRARFLRIEYRMRRYSLLSRAAPDLV